MTTTTDGPFDHVLSRLAGVRPSGPSGERWVAKCPAHDDSRPSLSVRLVGRTLYLKCFVGCEHQAILKRLGLTQADLRLRAGARPSRPGPLGPPGPLGQGRRGNASHPPRGAATLQHAPQTP